MTLDEIHFHDSILHKVVENTSSDTLEFWVSYPVDWDNNVFENRVIVFTDVLNYSVEEGQIHGFPTILGYSLLEVKDDRECLRIDTTAGHRTFCFGRVDLVETT